MPRAGSGGGSSSRRSSGGHSSSRSSGGHRVSSGGHSRAGSRSSSSFRSGGSSYRSSGPLFHGAPPPPPPYRGPGMPPPPPRGYRRRRYARTYYGGSSIRSGLLMSVVALIIITSMAFSLLSTFISLSPYSSSDIRFSTRNREKLNSGLSFKSNCIVDEIGWFDSVSKAGAKLRTFYDKTGVQPYIVLLKYHPELITDSQKEDYALEYYEDNIDNEATFLYMYFAEEDQDNDVGYMCYVNGKRVDSIMDNEAVEIFWGYLDRDWYTDKSTDALFADAFEKTADTIMKKSRIKTGIVFVVVVSVVIIGVIIAVIAAMNAKRRSELEQAAKTQSLIDMSRKSDR